MLYAVADAVVDHYMEVAAELQDGPGGAGGGGLLAGRRRLANTASRIYTFKRQVLEFRRATGPLAAPLARLAGAPGACPSSTRGRSPSSGTCSDHLTRVNESVEGLDRLVSDMLSAHLAQMGVRQNDDMRKISAWAAMAAVPTMVAGIYGMNFEHMPELRWSGRYPAVLVVMAGGGLCCTGMFKRRGWL